MSFGQFMRARPLVLKSRCKIDELKDSRAHTIVATKVHSARPVRITPNSSEASFESNDKVPHQHKIEDAQSCSDVRPLRWSCCHLRGHHAAGTACIIMHERAVLQPAGQPNDSVSCSCRPNLPSTGCRKRLWALQNSFVRFKHRTGKDRWMWGS